MRLTLTALLAVMMIGIGVPAFAELNNVEVGGSIRIRGNYYSVEAPSMLGADPDDYNSLAYTEQRTTLNVKADFTDDVTAFIEFDAYDHWGDDSFRENPKTGIAIDRGDDVHLYQSYIEMRDAWGYPLTIRIGRQEVLFGSEWLFGNNDTAGGFTGLSHDGITVTYSSDNFTLTGLFSKISETFATEEDGDVDAYALYGSYTGFEDLVIDGYVAFLRSAAGFAQGNEETVELTTVGARVAGERGAFDFEGEVAYQTGQAMVAIGVSGASDIDYDALGANVEIGFTLDNERQMRFFVGAAFFEGTDGDDVGFNRMFSDWEYSEFLGATDLSNVLIIRGGWGAQWTEKISTNTVLSWFQVDEETGSSDDNMGFEIGTAVTYDYSEDLYFELGWASFFVDDGTEDGNLIGGNGMFLVGGNGDDDAQYVYLETGIDF
jgi:hypothetical protein